MEEQQVPSNMYGWYLEERERGRKREREMIIVHRLAERSEGWSEGWRKGGERERERERERAQQVATYFLIPIPNLLGQFLLLHIKQTMMEH